MATDEDLYGWVGSTMRNAYVHPGVTQSIMPLTDAEIELAAGIVRFVRQHDASMVREAVAGARQARSDSGHA